MHEIKSTKTCVFITRLTAIIKLSRYPILFLGEPAKVVQPRLILLTCPIGSQFAFQFGEAGL